MTRAPHDLPAVANALRDAVERLEQIVVGQADETLEAQRRRLDALQESYDQLVSRYLEDTGPLEDARRRLAMVLAQMVNVQRIAGLAKPPSSPGQKVGALIDMGVYGAAYLLGLRRPSAGARLRAAMWDHWPGLFNWIQRRRGRPSLDVDRTPLESVVYEELHGGAGGVLRLRNLFTTRKHRDRLGLACRLLMSAVSQHGPVTHMYALNFNAGGGAELVTLAYARLAAEGGGTVCIVLTDPGPRLPMSGLPANVVVIDAGGDQENGLDSEERLSFIYLLWQTVAPGVFHIVNAEAAWRLITTTPRDLLPPGLIAASVFALQFDAARRPIGYAATFLPQASEALDILLTDNQRFADEGPDIVGAPIEPARRYVAPTPCRLVGAVSSDDALARLERRTSTRSDRLRVVWAGRLDKEKRTDLLLEIAGRMADRADFLVFGQSVVDRDDVTARLAAMPNVRMMGYYASPLAWDIDGETPQAFLFTSSWEGMPNTVIEAGWLGLPIVATNVGGVSDLVDASSGWLVEPEASAGDYVAALEAIRTNPDEARRRTTMLIQRVHARHTQATFEAAVRAAYAKSDEALAS